MIKRNHSNLALSDTARILRKKSKDLQKIFQRLETEKVIEAFEMMSIVPGTLVASVAVKLFYLKEKVFIHVYFFKASSLLAVASDRAHQFDIFSGLQVPTRNVRGVLRAGIERRRKGLKTESIFVETFTEVSERFHSPLRVRKASYREDRLGIDLWIYHLSNPKLKQVPLQIKSSICGQEKHMLFHRGIPSFFVFARYNADKLYSKTHKIFYGFQEDKILHF